VRFYLKQRGAIWQICWTNPDGSPGRKSAGTRDRREAEKALARHVIECDEPRHADPRFVTVEAVLVRYFKLHGRTRFSTDTLRAAIGVVCDEWPETPVADLTMHRQEQLRDKLLAKGRALSTVRRYLTTVWTAMKWMRDRGELANYPALMRFEMPRASAAARPASAAELGKLLAAAESDAARRWLLLCVATLCRPGAPLDLTWDRVGDGLIDFRPPGRRETKKRRAVVPMAGTLARYLEAQRGDGHVILRVFTSRERPATPYSDFRSLWERLRGASGVSADLDAYSVRKGVATLLRRRGVPDRDIKGMLGHRASAGVTDLYAQWDPNEMRAAADAIETLLSEVAPPWLATYLPKPVATPKEVEEMRVDSGAYGGRDRDRTCDPFHVNPTSSLSFQGLTPANDDCGLLEDQGVGRDA
jgi:integrase